MNNRDDGGCFQALLLTNNKLDCLLEQKDNK